MSSPEAKAAGWATSRASGWMSAPSTGSAGALVITPKRPWRWLSKLLWQLVRGSWHANRNPGRGLGYAPRRAHTQNPEAHGAGGWYAIPGTSTAAARTAVPA